MGGILGPDGKPAIGSEQGKTPTFNLVIGGDKSKGMISLAIQNLNMGTCAQAIMPAQQALEVSDNLAAAAMECGAKAATPEGAVDAGAMLEAAYRLFKGVACALADEGETPESTKALLRNGMAEWVEQAAPMFEEQAVLAVPGPCEFCGELMEPEHTCKALEHSQTKGIADEKNSRDDDVGDVDDAGGDGTG